MDLEDLGKIKRLTLPDDWLEEENKNEYMEMQSFVHPSEKEVKMSFYYCGRPLSARSAENLRNVLSKPAHELDPAERESIEVVIGDASEPEYFDLKSARTEDVKGVRVLIVEGFWKLSDVNSYAAFVDSEEDGVRIDEIYYLAPADKFASFLPVMQNALASIEWHT